MRDFSGWKQYKGTDGITNIGILSPDGRESKLLTAADVIAWLTIPGNQLKLI